MCRQDKQNVFTKGNIPHLGPRVYKNKKHTLLPHLPPTTVSQALHDRVDLRFKHLSQLGAVLVDAGRLAVVQPGVVEHQPDILHVLPRLLVLSRVQLPLDGRQVHGVLHDVKVVLIRQVEVKLRWFRGESSETVWSSKRERWRRRSSWTLWSSGEGVMKASTRRDQSRERRGCRGTMLLSAAEKKVRVQTERHDNFCPPALCFAPYI